MFEILETLNNKYTYNNNDGKLINNLNYLIKKGNIPVILSAPHAVKSKRNGTLKSNEIMTGAIVEYIADFINCFAITRVCNLDDDPNYLNVGPSLEYKQAILNLIKENDIVLLIDIHGCSNKHDFDIELGTNNGININSDNSIIDILSSNLSSVGSVNIDTYFKANLNCVISKYIHDISNIICVQIEISNNIRTNKEKLEKFISGLTKSILVYIELIKNKRLY